MIPDQVFQDLLSQAIKPQHRVIIAELQADQKKYKLLTKRKFAYFWTIYFKYLPIKELEYSKTTKISMNGYKERQILDPFLDLDNV